MGSKLARNERVMEWPTRSHRPTQCPIHACRNQQAQMSGQSMVRLGKTQGTWNASGTSNRQSSHHLDGSFTNSKPKCLPLNLPNFKKKTNRPKGYISQVKSISYGPVKMARPEKLDALGHFAVAREFTMALRQHCTSGLPRKNQEPSDPLQLITHLQVVPKQRYSQRGQLWDETHQNWRLACGNKTRSST